MRTLYLRAGIIGVAIAATLAACSGGDSSTPTSPTTPPPTGGGTVATITITSSGVSPKELTVTPGSRVTFVNNDSATHEMNSDPHPTHGDCPGIDDVGFLAAGQSKTSGNLNTVRDCGYHDHTRAFVSSLQGTIRVR